MNETSLAHPPRILVVDDDSDQLAMVSRLLERAGFTVRASPAVCT